MERDIEHAYAPTYFRDSSHSATAAREQQTTNYIMGKFDYDYTNNNDIYYNFFGKFGNSSSSRQKQQVKYHQQQMPTTHATLVNSTPMAMPADNKSRKILSFDTAKPRHYYQVDKRRKPLDSASIYDDTSSFHEATTAHYQVSSVAAAMLSDEYASSSISSPVGYEPRVGQQQPLLESSITSSPTCQATSNQYQSQRYEPPQLMPRNSLLSGSTSSSQVFANSAHYNSTRRNQGNLHMLQRQLLASPAPLASQESDGDEVEDIRHYQEDKVGSADSALNKLVEIEQLNLLQSRQQQQQNNNNQNLQQQQQQQPTDIANNTKRSLSFSNTPPKPDPSATSTLDRNNIAAATSSANDISNNNQNGASNSTTTRTYNHTSNRHSRHLNANINHSNNMLNTSGQYCDKPAKQPVDLYSIPVFILELLALSGIGCAAYYLHYVHVMNPWLSGFYCDDISYTRNLIDSWLTRAMHNESDEPVFLLITLILPIVIIVFCELVNSMFGALKFRKVRALCECCKLHSITRRTIRFSGAYILGFLILMISVDVLTTTTGRLRPYFQERCPIAYRDCKFDARAEALPTSIASIPGTSSFTNAAGRSFKNINSSVDDNNLSTLNSSSFIDPSVSIPSPTVPITAPASPSIDAISVLTTIAPPAQPHSVLGLNSSIPITSTTITNDSMNSTTAKAEALVAATGDDIVTPGIETFSSSSRQQRIWIDLSDKKLNEVCQFDEETIAEPLLYATLAKSWPSLPAAMVSFACFYLSTYLSFVGTARPFRIVTSTLIIIIMLFAIVFDVDLAKRHYNHWDDVLAGSLLSFVIVIFILFVYLNKFKDTHYYKNQKISHNPRSYQGNNRGNDDDDMTIHNAYEYQIGKRQQQQQSMIPMTQLDSSSNPISNNSPSYHHSHQLDLINNSQSGNTTDLPRRHFQIPRANYRSFPNQ